MTTAKPRSMCFNLRPIRPLLEDGGGSRWQWIVYSYFDLTFLRDGEIVGDRAKAEQAARTAVLNMGGVVEVIK